MMHLTAYFDLVFLLAVLFGLICLLRGGRDDFRGGTKLILACLLGFMVIYGLCMFLEWSGITVALEELEDLIGALVPMWWGLVFYAFVHDVTHRDIQRSEEKYRSLVANVPDVLWTTGQDGHTSFISSNVEKVYGYTPEEIYAEGEHIWLGRIHPDDVESVKGAFEDVFAKGVPLDIEYRIRRKDGEWIWLHDRSVGAYEKDGTKHADGVFCDVTERKRSLEDLERIFNLSGYMVCVATMDGYFSKISPTFETVLGYSSEELLSRPFIDFVHPDDRAKTIAVVEEELSAGIELVGFENRYRCKDGGYKWLGWSSRPVVEEGIMFAIAHDITDRKLAEEEVRATNERLNASNQQLTASEQQLRASNQQLSASEKQLRASNQELTASEQQLRASNQQLTASEQELRESRHLLDATINNSPAVIYVKDLDGCYLLVNKSYEKILGRYREDMLGKTDEDLFPKDVAAKFRANDLLALESDAPLEFEEVALHASGELHTYISIKFPLLDKDGSPYAVCGISTDITARKRIEGAIASVVSQNASSVGQEFLDGMTQQLCEILGAYCSFIGETAGEKLVKVITKSMYCDGRMQEDVEYDLAGTPCENVIGKKVCTYPRGVCEEFPEDVMLQKMGVKAYVGVPLFGSQGEAIGIMVALFRREVEDAKFVESILELFAARTVGEIVRMRAEEALEEQLAFETLIAGLSGKFVNLPADLVDQEITEGVRQIVEFLGVDRGGILEFSGDQSELHATHTYAVAGIRPIPVIDVGSRFPWITEKLRRGETVCVSRPDELPEEAESERQFVVEEGQKAVLMTPLKVGGSILGALTVGVLRGERSWSDETILRLQLVGGIFGNALMRRRTENALRESEVRYRAIVEDQTEFIVRWRSGGVRTFVNESYCRYYGVSQDEAIGSSFFGSISEEDRAAVRKRVMGLSVENPVCSGEHRVVRPDGSVGWNHWTDRAIFDKDGGFIEYQSVGRDITERKRLEEQERKHHEELVHFSRLTIAGELASGMAHELNQPLTAITTYAQACQRMIDSGNADSPKIREATEEIAAQAMRGGEIIRRMRDFVRKQVPQRVEADFNDIVREAIGLVQMQAKDSDVILRLEYSEQPLMVLVDEIQIEQVLVNLLQNGFDSMVGVEPCDRVLTVRTSRTDKGMIEIAVEDKGMGLSEADAERVFESFFTTKPGGLGIGLSISRSIVEEHEGHIWATPNPKKGTTFKVALPSK